ncbi:hypothetical protein VW35_12885 [Devosia soli]|uniref:Sulfur carrier protein FdhD n=1 Tax=Devosia soli TaxID=361041 RepID=A0A0F5L6H3_9HYPH|nr:formate dehydrogenase accessory sulfurtransferase FdhD [Devosia soli]KKB78006.1 hypothetical protein VW35_12885 [Devosia soli]
MSFATHVTSYPEPWGRGLAQREIAEEAAVAIVVNGTTLAVMMATPADLEAFGIGFALSEGVIDSVDQIERLEVIDHHRGIEVRLWVDQPRAMALLQRRRQSLGPTGCGLCGIESLEQALRPSALVSSRLDLTPHQVMEAMDALRLAQSLNAETHAVHAAGLWHPKGGLLAVCEDVGRHNALDKLLGRSRQLRLPTTECALLLTSRISVDLVQKATVLDVPLLIAVSAPTRLALETAAEAGLQVIAVARGDGFERFSPAASARS